MVMTLIGVPDAPVSELVPPHPVSPSVAAAVQATIAFETRLFIQSSLLSFTWLNLCRSFRQRPPSLDRSSKPARDLGRESSMAPSDQIKLSRVFARPPSTRTVWPLIWLAAAEARKSAVAAMSSLLPALRVG